jgi:hypothetical protein
MRRDARIVRPSDGETGGDDVRYVDIGVGSARIPEEETRNGRKTLVRRLTMAFMNNALDPARVASAARSGSSGLRPPAIASRV